MSQNSEQIEAKLCAYLEGELDESGRAEIEKHLQQNPAHRKLLAEVGKTRNLLRALPREPAPPDICEAFQGQLERSVLLADLDDEADHSSMKIRRWPQYLAVAAVVMLAAGLGMVVYFGLPSGLPDGDYAVGDGGSGGRPTEDGAATRSIAPAGGVPAVPEKPESPREDYARRATRDGADSAALTPDALAKKDLADRDLALAPAGPPAASAPATAPAEELTVLARRVQGSWETKERQRLFSATGVSDAETTLRALDNIPADAACYVVTTARPGVAAEQIGRELSRLQVEWSAVPQPDPVALQTKLESKVALDVGGESPAPRPETTALSEGVSPGASPAEAPDATHLRQADAGVAFRGSRGAGVGAAPAMEQENIPGPNPSTGVRAPLTQPAPQYAVGADKESEMALGVTAEKGRGFAFTPDGSGRAETLIVARGLTREQAEMLRVSLDAGAPERRVAAFGTRQLAAAPKAVAGSIVVEEGSLEVGLRTGAAGRTGSPAPADEAVIQQGDALRLVTGGEHGEQTVTEVQVGRNGAVTIPGIGLLQCEGLTVAQLQQRLAADERARGGGAVVAGKPVEVIKLGKAKDAAGATPSEPGPLAAATEADPGQRAVRRARNDAMLRGGLERAAEGRGQPPAAAARPSLPPPAPAPAAPVRSGPAPTAPLPTAGASAAPAPSAAPPSTPAPRPSAPGATATTATTAARQQEMAEARGGSAGSAGTPPDAGSTQQRRGALDEVAESTDRTGQDRGVSTTAAVEGGDERFDVVILVRDAGPAGASTPSRQADANAGQEPEPQSPIEPYEILMIQLGDAEADLANVRVGDDGTVELPRLGRVKAAGLTSAQLKEQITAKLTENAANAPAPAVTVKRLSNADAAGAEPAPDAPRPESAPAAEEPGPSADTVPPAAQGSALDGPATGTPPDEGAVPRL